MANVIPAEVVIWQFGGKSGAVRAQNGYTTNSGHNLYCSANKQYLTYGKTLVGINLDWIKSAAEKKIHFRVPDGSERQLTTGEPVALGVGGGDAFLYYTSRTSGINLAWSAKPRFEWVIIAADGRKGVPVDEGQTYAILNLKVQPDADFLVYLDRVPGQADIGWTTSPNWPGKVLGGIDKYKGAAAAVAALM